MHTKGYFLFFIAMGGWSFLQSCHSPETETTLPVAAPATAKFDTLPPATSANNRTAVFDSVTILKLNHQVLTACATRDYKQLASFIHPQKGVRFSFYGYIDTATDRLFSPARFEEYAIGPKKNQKLVWGTEMEGEKVQLDWANFCKAYVYDKDFLHADTLAYNKVLRSTMDETVMKIVYFNKPFVDNHFPGFEEKYGGMDWKSLRLVFDTYKSKYYLIGVINDEWTP